MKLTEIAIIDNKKNYEIIADNINESLNMTLLEYKILDWYLEMIDDGKKRRLRFYGCDLEFVEKYLIHMKFDFIKIYQEEVNFGEEYE